MNIVSVLQQAAVEGVKALYDTEVEGSTLPVTPTRKEFTGDYTLVTFPLVKSLRKNPLEIGEELGKYMVDQVPQVDGFNVIKGFLNLEISDRFWIDFVQREKTNTEYGQAASKDETVVVEFSSPNTNKPLHLGHIRNILLGWSSSMILQKAGYAVKKVQIINDRGIAICKSMLAWKRFGEGQTPASTGIKGDHFVGKYYVAFEKAFQAEYAEWQKSPQGQEVFEANSKAETQAEDFFKGYKNKYFNLYSALGAEAKQMLLDWEAGKPEVIELWKQMNGWVYAGFDSTYEQMGVSFDKLYYESNTYLLGKDKVLEGLEKGTFYQKEDQSVWIDLEEAKMDQKLVLRSDGTSVYMTQDIGTAILRYEDFKAEKMVYVVADEQNYHFKALFEILKRMGEPFAEGCYHLSYGMVELPEGRMKSREGTVVDADVLMAEVIGEAKQNMVDRGAEADFSPEALEETSRKIGLAALKYFIIKVQPKKWMTFNPSESLDMQGQTGPYIQYSYVRIKGILARAEKEGVDLGQAAHYTQLEDAERAIIKTLYTYPELIAEAAQHMDPSLVAGFAYTLAKMYSKMWHDLPVFKAEESAKAFRLELSALVGIVLEDAMRLLGIEMPERM